MHSKNINKTLSEDIQQAQVDFQVYKDKSEICFKQLETKVNEKSGLDTQINDLTAKVTEGWEYYFDLQNLIQLYLSRREKKITELTNNVQSLTEAKTSLEAKVAELEAAKAEPKKEEPKKEEPKKEEPKAEEAKKEETKTEEAKTEAPKE